jgi:hypothetical protein
MIKPTCPKCHAMRDTGPECPQCGVIYAKAEAAAQAAAQKIATEAERLAIAEAEEKSMATRKIEANLQFCRTCSKTFAKSIAKCPHCGAKKPTTHVGKTGLTFAGLFTIVMIYGMAQHTPPAAGERTDEQTSKATANIACTDYLKAHLRDPDSLVIDAAEQSAGTPGGDGYITVFTTLSVRARNGFGGMNRERYYCEAEVHGLKYRITQFAKTT